MQLMRTGSKGFTLVELITVMVLVGILSVYAAPRLFASRSNFSAQAAQEQAIAIIRQVQLGRMQSNIDPAVTTLSTEYQLAITANCLGSVAGCNLRDDNRSNHLLLSPDSATPDDVQLTFAPLQTVNFDLLGAPVGGRVQINISSATETVLICINSEGYVHRGECI